MSKYDLLNPEQKEAVFHYEGPLLIRREPDPERREC